MEREEEKEEKKEGSGDRVPRYMKHSPLYVDSKRHTIVVPLSYRRIGQFIGLFTMCRVPKRPRGASRQFETVSTKGRGLVPRSPF